MVRPLSHTHAVRSGSRGSRPKTRSQEENPMESNDHPAAPHGPGRTVEQARNLDELWPVIFWLHFVGLFAARKRYR